MDRELAPRKGIQAGSWSRECKGPKAAMLSVGLEKHKRAHGTREEQTREWEEKQLEVRVGEWGCDRNLWGHRNMA